MKSKDATRFVALATALTTRDATFIAAMEAHNPIPATVEELRQCVDAAVRATGSRAEQMFVHLGRTSRTTMRKVVGYDHNGKPQPELMPGERFYTYEPNGRPCITRSKPDAHP